MSFYRDINIVSADGLLKVDGSDVVQPISGSIEAALTPADVLAYSEATSVSASTLTTIVSRTALDDEVISSVVCSGEDYAKFQLFIDTVLVATMRSGPDRNVVFQFGKPFNLAFGSVLDVKVTHFFTSETLDFEAAIVGN